MASSSCARRFCVAPISNTVAVSATMTSMATKASRKAKPDSWERRRGGIADFAADLRRSKDARKPKPLPK
jgi:hypothetical protein